MKKVRVSPNLIFVAAIFNSLCTTLVSNIFIPNLISQSAFSEWRQILTILAYAGLAHVGLADGLQYIWTKERGIPRKSLTAQIGGLVILLSTIMYGINGFVSQQWGSPLYFLFMLTAFSPFFLNYFVSHSNSSGLVVFYFSQPFLFLTGIFTLKYLGVSGINLAIGCQIIVLLLGILYSLVVFKNNSAKINDKINFRTLWQDYNGIGLYSVNLLLITIFSIDRIVALKVLSESEKTHYFFLSLFVTLSSTLTMVISNIIFSRNIVFSFKMINIFRIGTAMLFAIALLFPENIYEFLIKAAFPKFSSSYVGIYVGAAILAGYFNVIILPIIKRYAIGRFMIISPIIMIGYALLCFIFVKNSQNLIISYSLFLMALIIVFDFISFSVVRLGENKA
ncbi:hypothetical protein WDJ50_07745 [Deinococcus sp. VB142]|uniref:Polysaccharide biosynthesis protein n=1 Tax=Deinococcus sp. VB142 TaxID=3112952 RepID=A0AAU6PZ91_9DEIO